MAECSKVDHLQGVSGDARPLSLTTIREIGAGLPLTGTPAAVPFPSGPRDGRGGTAMSHLVPVLEKQLAEGKTLRR